VEQCGAGPKAKVEVVEEFIVGQTCIGCSTTYEFAPFPPFQLRDAKHGEYDVTRQIPGCAERFPLCSRCLPWYWRDVAKRLGVVQEVKEVYAGCFK